MYSCNWHVAVYTVKSIQRRDRRECLRERLGLYKRGHLEWKHYIQGRTVNLWGPELTVPGGPK